MNGTVHLGRKSKYPKALQESERVLLLVEEAVEQLRKEAEESLVISASTRIWVDAYRARLQEDLNQ